MPRVDEYHELFGDLEYKRTSAAWVYAGLAICTAVACWLGVRDDLSTGYFVVTFGVASVWYVLVRTGVHLSDQDERSYYKSEILAEHVTALLKRIDALEREVPPSPPAPSDPKLGM